MFEHQWYIALNNIIVLPSFVQFICLPHNTLCVLCTLHMPQKRTLQGLSFGFPNIKNSFNHMITLFVYKSHNSFILAAIISSTTLHKYALVVSMGSSLNNPNRFAKWVINVYDFNMIARCTPYTTTYSHLQVHQNSIKVPDCSYRLPLCLGKADHSKLADFNNKFIHVALCSW